MLDADATSAEASSKLAFARTLQGRLHLADGELAAARSAIEQAVTLRDSLLQTDPEGPACLRELAASVSSIGSALRKLGEVDAAVPHYERSFRLYEKLCARHPGATADELGRIRAQINLACVHLSRRCAVGDDRAEALLDASKDELEALRSAGKLVGHERAYEEERQAIETNLRILAWRRSQPAPDPPPGEEARAVSGPLRAMSD